MTDNKVTTTIRIESGLKDKVKHAAINLKIRFNDFIIQAIKDKLNKCK